MSNEQTPSTPVTAPQDIIDRIVPQGVENEDELRDVLNSNWMSIKDFFKCHKIMDVMNVCLVTANETTNIQQLTFDAFMRVWNETRWKVKVNASVGCILVHKTTGKYRYFHSSVNNGALFDQPAILSTNDEAEELLENINSMDLQEKAFRARPNTEWGLFAMTNMTFYFYKMIGISRAGGADELPTYVKRNRHLLSLLTDAKSGKAYKDKLCFFRCLAVRLDCVCSKRCKCSRARNRTVKCLLRKYKEAKNITQVEFPGIDETELLFLEKLFDVTITVFELREDKSSTVLWNSGKQQAANGRLNLNLFANHFSYIRNIEAFARDFQCSKCNAQFTRASSCRRHSCVVSEVTRFTFPGGAFAAPRCIWDEVSQDLGVDVPQHLRILPYRATFDIESLLTKENLPADTNTTSYENRHTLLSVSVCSNVPGFSKPLCFVVEDSALECIRRFVFYLENISERAEKLNLNRYSKFLDRVARVVAHREKRESKFEDATLSNPKHYARRANCSDIQERIRSYIAILPVFGFNSQRYDLNVIKPHLMRILTETPDQDDDETVGQINFVVKKQDSMTCIQTATLRFLDTTNFIPPGYTYEAYLKAHGASLAKGFFPYEWMDDIEKLNHKALPNQEAFFSRLSNKTISDKDYASLKETWDRLQMKSVRDLLIWYNNLDVEPFLEALQKQYAIYASRGIDMGRQAISLPGLAVLWMESVVGTRPSNRETFAVSPVGNDKDKYTDFYQSIVNSLRVQLIDEDNRELHQLFRNNLVGGPSIVFHRFHAKGETLIRPTEAIDDRKVCRLIQGYDANALYLYCIMQDMPVGRPVRRLCENSFRPSPTRNISKTAQGWLAWMEFLSNTPIQTSMNDREARLGRHGLLVDGYAISSSTVYQFHGCYWHGHGCSSNSLKTIGERDSVTRKKETLEKEAYLTHLGYKVVSIWECEWNSTVKGNKNLELFLKAFFDVTFGCQKAYTQEQLIASIQTREIFGFAECDIEVPPHLREKFSEMSPIFKNVSLSRSDLSPHMRTFAEDNGFLKRPQRCLVGSMHAQKQLFLTTLLNWYIEHGLVVTHIHQVVQFHPLSIFESFGESVTEARRKGDVDPDLRLLANNAKLVGNSMYGKTIINKTTHRDTKYVADDSKASQIVRSAHFHSLNVLEEELYETTCFKKKVNLCRFNRLNDIRFILCFLFIGVCFFVIFLAQTRRGYLRRKRHPAAEQTTNASVPL